MNGNPKLYVDINIPGRKNKKMPLYRYKIFIRLYHDRKGLNLTIGKIGKIFRMTKQEVYYAVKRFKAFQIIKNNAVDFVYICEKFKGKWVALSNKGEVIASGINAKKVFDEAKKKGYKIPILFKVPTSQSARENQKKQASQ